MGEGSREDWTIGFYDMDPAGYFDFTYGADMSEERGRFTRHLAVGSRILDLGCGTCRDTEAFMREGFAVVPADASSGMRAEVKRRLGLDVMPLRFGEMRFDAEFDGVWASACLLHVPSEDLPDVLERIRRALVPGGVFYCSFKDSGEEGYRSGRWYRDLDADGLRGVLEGAGFSVIDLWSRTAVDGTTWSNAVSCRQRYEPPGHTGRHEVQKPAEEEGGWESCHRRYR